MAHVQVILERMMTCYSTALEGSNKGKLEQLYRLLMERLQVRDSMVRYLWGAAADEEQLLISKRS